MIQSKKEKVDGTISHSAEERPSRATRMASICVISRPAASIMDAFVLSGCRAWGLKLLSTYDVLLIINWYKTTWSGGAGSRSLTGQTAKWLGWTRSTGSSYLLSIRQFTFFCFVLFWKILCVPFFVNNWYDIFIRIILINCYNYNFLSAYSSCIRTNAWKKLCFFFTSLFFRVNRRQPTLEISRYIKCENLKWWIRA